LLVVVAGPPLLIRVTPDGGAVDGDGWTVAEATGVAVEPVLPPGTPLKVLVDMLPVAA
jgi:hypothetical protein